MNENPANDYYPKDFFQSQKKEEQKSSSSAIDSIVAMLSAGSPLLSSFFNGQNLDQKSLIQALSSSLKQNNTSQQTKTSSLDDDFCEEL